MLKLELRVESLLLSWFRSYGTREIWVYVHSRKQKANFSDAALLCRDHECGRNMGMTRATDTAETNTLYYARARRYATAKPLH